MNDASRSMVDAVIRHVDRRPQYLSAYRPKPSAKTGTPAAILRLDGQRKLIEDHLRSHADSSYAGWLALRAGTLAFIRRDFPAACQLLKSGSEREWQLPDADGQDRTDRIAAAKYIIENLRAEGLCP